MKLPTLSTTGATGDPLTAANELLVCFYLSEEAQTYFYTNSIKSIKYILSLNKDVNDTYEMIVSQLTSMFQQYGFVDILILGALNNNDNDKNIYELDINITMRFKGRPIKITNNPIIDMNTGVINIDTYNELNQGI